MFITCDLKYVSQLNDFDKKIAMTLRNMAVKIHGAFERLRWTKRPIIDIDHNDNLYVKKAKDGAKSAPRIKFGQYLHYFVKDQVIESLSKIVVLGFYLQNFCNWEGEI